MFPEPRFIVTFFNHEEAMAFQDACEAAGVEGRLIPIPRQLTAGCGLVWSAPLTARAPLMNLLEDPTVSYSERTILELNS